MEPFFIVNTNTKETTFFLTTLVDPDHGTVNTEVHEFVTSKRKDKTMIELAILSLLGLGILSGPSPLTC